MSRLPTPPADPTPPMPIASVAMSSPRPRSLPSR
jgi:hypothetical protein